MWWARSLYDKVLGGDVRSSGAHAQPSHQCLSGHINSASSWFTIIISGAMHAAPAAQPQRSRGPARWCYCIPGPWVSCWSTARSSALLARTRLAGDATVSQHGVFFQVPAINVHLTRAKDPRFTRFITDCQYLKIFPFCYNSIYTFRERLINHMQTGFNECSSLQQLPSLVCDSVLAKY